MIYAPDVSYFQKPVDDSFTRQWLIFRCCDGTFPDPNAATNAAWCRKAAASGRLLGWTTYVVYRPGWNAAVIQRLKALGPLDRVMIDVESWPVNGKPSISGDHSREINVLVDAVAALVGQGNVWVYGNVGDLDAIYPWRRPYVQYVIAAYGTVRPTWPNMVGWQYTDGRVTSDARPSVTPPFGRCDHNELYVDGLSGQGGGTPITEDIDMTPEQAARLVNIEAILGRVQNLILDPAIGIMHRADNATAAGNNAAEIASEVRNALNDPAHGVLVRVAALQAALAALPSPVGGAPVDVTGLAAQILALPGDVVAALVSKLKELS